MDAVSKIRVSFDGGKTWHDTGIMDATMVIVDDPFAAEIEAMSQAPDFMGWPIYIGWDVAAEARPLSMRDEMQYLKRRIPERMTEVTPEKPEPAWKREQANSWKRSHGRRRK